MKPMDINTELIQSASDAIAGMNTEAAVQDLATLAECYVADGDDHWQGVTVEGLTAALKRLEGEACSSASL